MEGAQTRQLIKQKLGKFSHFLFSLIKLQFSEAKTSKFCVFEEKLGNTGGFRGYGEI